MNQTQRLIDSIRDAPHDAPRVCPPRVRGGGVKRAIALVTESTRRDGTRQGFAAPRPVGAPLTEPAPPPKKDRLRGRCPSESSPGSRAPNPDSSHSNWTILWGQVSRHRIPLSEDVSQTGSSPASRYAL